MKKYKALDLYNLSERKNIYQYNWYTSKKNNYIIKWFLINDKNRKEILNQLLKYTLDLDVTKKLLDKNIKYIVWLFSENNNSIVLLKFGSNKDILAVFNDKVTSNQFKDYFDWKEEIEKNINSLNNLNLNINNLELDENVNDNKFKKLEDYKNIKNVENFIDQLNEDKYFSSQDLIENEEKISEILNTIENELEKMIVKKSFLKKIIQIQYPFAHKVKFIALEKLKELDLKEESKSKVNDRFWVLQDV